MWNERFLKVIPAVVFLFCLLEIFELGLIINGIDKNEKLEYKIENNLKVLESIVILLEDTPRLEHFEDKKNRIK